MMAYEGYVDAADNGRIRGWIFDEAAVDRAISIEILDADRVVATVVADQYRADLAAAGKGNGYHAFDFQLGDNRRSTALAARVVGQRWLLPSSGRQRLVTIRTEARLAHPLQYGFPQAKSTFSVPSQFPNELETVQRLVDAYHRTLKDDPQYRSDQKDVWSQIAESYHREIIDLLRQRDIKGIAEYLRDAHAKGIAFGISQGDAVTTALRTQPNARQFVITQYLDYLASLAESLGVLNLECPEQHGLWAENLYGDPQILVDQISDAIGISVVPPQVIGSCLGIETVTGSLCGRDLLALYASLRLQRISGKYQVASPSICEIGGGYGASAYYSTLLGAAQYTIIDLPLISLLQGYYLLRALPDRQIQLYGEEAAAPAVRLLPTYCFADDSLSYDLLLNQDSMPEMHREYSLAYLRNARRLIRHGFLSINQEARAPLSGGQSLTVVRELVESVGGYHCDYRFRHWLRAGYVEEFYSTAATPLVIG